jgi:hypothetical protein
MKITANKKQYEVTRKRLDIKKLENAQPKQEYTSKLDLGKLFEARNHSHDDDI